MSRLRFFVACLLLLAYPWQAMAAVAMVRCSGAPGHAHLMAAAGDDDQAGHAVNVAHHHAAADPGDSATATHAHPGSSVDAKCNACASCCIGAVAAHEPRVPAFELPSIAAVPASTAAMRLRTTAPPDKPPRA